MEHQAWAAEMYPQRYILDASMHVDEPNAMIHVHERVVWVGHDGHNMEVACQEKALREMGIPSPDPTRESNRYNNRKMVFSAENREHFIQTCQAHGVDVEMEPLPSSQVGLSIAAYKRMRMQEKLATSAQQLDMLERQFMSGEVAVHTEDIAGSI